MSIQKNTPNFLKHSGLSFTTIINHTMDLIKDPGALGIYCYLASKPTDWNICNKDLAKRFEKGRDYITKQLNYLKKLGLIKTQSIRDEKGKIIHWETILINFLETQITENQYCGQKPRLLKNQNLEKPESGKTGTTNKRNNTNKIKSKNKRESSPSKMDLEKSQKTVCPESLEAVISDEAIEIADNKYLDIKEIFYKFKIYSKSHGFLKKDWKAAFIKWLLDEKVINNKSNNGIYDNNYKLNTTHCAIPDFGPGHPTWEAMQRWKKDHAME